MQTTYILVIKGKPEGPFSLDELKMLKVRPGDFIKTAEMPDFKEAHEMPELRELFGFRREPLLVQYYGSFDQRLLATALDWFIILGAFVFVAFVSAMFVPEKEVRTQVVISIMLFAPIARLIYNIIMECSKKQATIGKQLLKITVCDRFGDRLSVGRAAFRNIAKIISVIPLFAGYLLAFFSKEHKALHDDIAGTMVIRDRLM